MGACNAKDGGRGQITVLHLPHSVGCQYLVSIPMIPEYLPRSVGPDGGTVHCPAFLALHKVRNSESVRKTYMANHKRETVDELYDLYVTSSALAREKNPGVAFAISTVILGCPVAGAPWEVVGAFVCSTYDRHGNLSAARTGRPQGSTPARGEFVGVFRDRDSPTFGTQQYVGFNIVRLAVMQYRLAFEAEESNVMNVPWPRAVDISFGTHNIGCAALLKELACHTQELGLQVGITVFETQKTAATTGVRTDHADHQHMCHCIDAATIARFGAALVSAFDASKKLSVSVLREFPGLAAHVDIPVHERCNVVATFNPRGAPAGRFSNVPFIMTLLGIHAQARAETAALAKGPVRVAHNPYAFAALEHSAPAAAVAAAPSSSAAPSVAAAAAASVEVAAPLVEEAALQRLLQTHGACYPPWGIVMAMMLLLREVHAATRGPRVLSEETFAIYVCREIVRTHRPSLAVPLSAIRESSFSTAVVLGSLLSGSSLVEMRRSVIAAGRSVCDPPASEGNAGSPRSVG